LQKPQKHIHQGWCERVPAWGGCNQPKNQCLHAKIINWGHWGFVGLVSLIITVSFQLLLHGYCQLTPNNNKKCNFKHTLKAAGQFKNSLVIQLLEEARG
jgi:hypothetical protein